jgi:drug/metabolite transporter (DMT)-like permease
MLKNNSVTKWGLFILLAIVWGSSFKLMLIGLGIGLSKPTLSPWQLAAFRMFWAGLVLLPLAYKAIKAIPSHQRNYAILSGFLGSFFPAFLFCLAEQPNGLDGSFAGTLNSLTPIFVLLVGFLFFKTTPTKWQFIGIAVSFLGSIALFFSKSGKTGDLVYVGYVILATILYGLNVNMVGKKLKNVASINIAALAFSFLTIPSLLILLATGAHQLNFNDAEILQSVGASALLGILGTTVASILFYVLMKRAGGVFASTVTYGIPFIALFWGILDNERTNIWVWCSLLLILSGIFITNAMKPKLKQ